MKVNNLKLGTMQEVMDNYNALIGGCYNSMLDNDKDYLSEVKELLLSDEKIKEYLYNETVSFLKSYQKNIKFDGKQNILDYIQKKLNRDKEDMTELRTYLKNEVLT